MNTNDKNKDKKAEFLDILNNQRTAQKLLRYLDIEDVHNLMICNRRIYFSFINPQTYIYNKYMFKKYKDNYLFFYNNNIKIKNLHQILEVINYSDEIYKSIYKKTNTSIIIYYFIGCFLILDLFVLFVMINNKVEHFADYLPQIPLVLFWVLCIFQLIFIFIIEKSGINKIRKKLREKKIVNENSLLEKNILYNISKRLYHKRPVSYRPICYTYIFCYIPIIYKSFNSLRYSTAFLYISAIFCTIGLFLDFAFFIIYKNTHILSKKDVYKSINFDNKEYFEYKMLNILSYYPKTSVSEIRFGFLYYFFLSVFHGVIIFYSYLIGNKLDDENFGVSWRILLIPLYIICFIIVAWGCIYIYSIKRHKSKYICILVITIIIILVCTITNCVFWPNFYISNKGILRYFPIVIDGIITITAMVHWFFLYRSKKIYDSEEI